MRQTSKKIMAFVSALLAVDIHRRNIEDEDSHHKRMLCVISCSLFCRYLLKKMNRPRVTVFFPSQVAQQFDDDTFEKMFRFRRSEFGMRKKKEERKKGIGNR